MIRSSILFLFLMFRAHSLSVEGCLMFMPDNYTSVDSIGLCIDKDYRIIIRQSVFLKVCLARQYLFVSGVCVNVTHERPVNNPNDSEAQLFWGVCCSNGTIYSQNRGICVRENVFQGVGNVSITRHPSLSICLKCPDN
jgi:hypothetical protein